MKKHAVLILCAVLAAAAVFGGCGTAGAKEPEAETEAKEAEDDEKNPEEEAAPGETAETEIPKEDADAENRERAEQILSSMTLEDKAAQMLMPAFRTWKEGEETNDVTELNEKQEALLKKYHFGGVILFAQNLKDAEQSRDLVMSLQKASLEGGAPTALFIATDQEGGGVSRLVTGTQMPGNMALGATGDPDAARQAAALMGEELSSVGINMDFAPVMDVNSNPANPVIGVRSFSDDPETAAVFGTSFTEGLHSQGVISALKHFPGHGDTDSDSHTGLPVIDKSLEDLRSCELIPFESGLQEADMVMTAHILYPQIEKDTYISKMDGNEITLPATLSRTIITGLLREELGFDGVVVTDAMNMDAIAAHFDPMDAVRLAVNAGVDMMLMPVDLSTEEGIAAMDDYISDITAMIESGEISQERVDEAVTRILVLKGRYGLLDPDSLSMPEPSIGTKEHHDAEWDLALRAVTLLKNEEKILPLKDRKKVLISLGFASQVNSALYAAERAREEGILSQDTEILTQVYGEMTPEDVRNLPEGIDTVIAVSVMYSPGNLNPESESGARSLRLNALFEAAKERGIQTVMISSQLPYDAAAFPQADAVLCCYNGRGMTEIPDFSGPVVYEYGPNLPAAIYTAFGGNAPQGKLPVNIPVLKEDYTFGEEILFERGTGLTYE